MPKKLKIAIYSGQIPSTTFIESLIKTVCREHEILLFGSKTKAINYVNKNIKVYKTPNSNWLKLLYNCWRSLLLGLQRPKDLIALLKEVKNYKTRYKKWQSFSKLLPVVLYKPNVFHIQWAKNLEEFMVLKTVFNIPIVLSLRGAHINYSPIVSEALAASYRENFPQVDGFHAVSIAIGKEAEKYGATAHTIQVIHSIVPSLFLDAYQPLKPNAGKLLKLVSIGRAHWIKGYSYALQAINELKNLGYTIKYQIVGINEPDEELLFLIEQFGLIQEVRLLPTMQQTELLKMMQSQDALLLSSLEEGIANAVLEAMAIGLPVISTNCGGMGEVIIPGETGFLIPVRDGKAMAQAVIDLRNMPYDHLKTQTENAHILIKSKFNAEENVNQFLELYNQASLNG